MADTKISSAAVVTGTGLLSMPVALAGSTTKYRRVDNLSASADPAVGDDSADGFHVGSLWMRSDTGEVWLCLDATAAAAVWQRLAPGLGANQIPYFTSSTTYLATAISGSPGAGAITADRLHMLPIVVPKRRAFTTLAVTISTAGAAGKLGRLGVYNANQDTAKPTTLIQEGGAAVAVDSTGTKTATISQTLLPGLYYLAFVSDGAPQTNNAPSNSAFLLGKDMSGTTVTSIVSLFRAFTYGALGDETASSWSVSAGGTTSPVLGIR